MISNPIEDLLTN